jgi:hypothetical protein
MLASAQAVNIEKTIVGFFTGRGGLQPNWSAIMARENISFLNSPPDMRTILKAGQILAMAGVLSSEKDGNYEVIFKTIIDGRAQEMSANPKIDEETYYFVKEGDAKQFMALRGFGC